MSETFTHGPWCKYCEDGEFTGLIITDENRPTGFSIVAENVGENEADLIAAAPDLYAALKCLYDKLLMSDRDGQSHISEEEGEMALGALRKARGEA